MNICSISQCFYVFYAEKDICVRTTECDIGACSGSRIHRRGFILVGECTRTPERGTRVDKAAGANDIL
jgi:hypothetical protein